MKGIMILSQAGGQPPGTSCGVSCLDSQPNHQPSTHLAVHDRGCSLKLFKREIVQSLRLYGQLHRFPRASQLIGVKIVKSGRRQVV